MKCPACGQMLKRIEGVCGEYICINPGCPKNEKAHVQAYAEFYGLTQAEIYANYREALTKKQEEDIALSACAHWNVGYEGATLKILRVLFCLIAL